MENFTILLKNILSDQDGNFGVRSGITISKRRLKGGSYDQKLIKCEWFLGFQFGRWRWCYLGRGGPKYGVPPIIVAPLLPYRRGGCGGIGGFILFTIVFHNDNIWVFDGEIHILLVNFTS